MTEETENLVLEHLRHIREKVDSNTQTLQEMKQQLFNVRDDINGLRSDLLRQERALAAVEVDIDRIKTRLDLSD